MYRKKDRYWGKGRDMDRDWYTCRETFMDMDRARYRENDGCGC